jgi:hypothetical protein
MEATIEVSGLRKRFGPARALDGRTFTARLGRGALIGGQRYQEPAAGSLPGAAAPGSCWSACSHLVLLAQDLAAQRAGAVIQQAAGCKAEEAAR